MELRQLEMLLAVVESGSYAAAGERLHISHSAIHRQVRLLEHELDDRLLVRQRAHVQLTATGQIVVEHARRIRQDIANLRRQIEEIAQLHTGRLTVGTGSTMLQFFLPPVIKRFRKEFRGVDVHLMTGTAHEVIEELKAGNLDLGIVFGQGDLPLGRENFSYEPLYREEFVWAVSKTHPLTKPTKVSLAQISNYPLITYSKTSYIRKLVERMLDRAHLKPNIILELESEESMAKMAEIDMGVAFLAKRRVVRDRIHYLRSSEGPVEVEVGIILPKISYIPPAVKEFTRMCREAGVAF